MKYFLVLFLVVLISLSCESQSVERISKSNLENNLSYLASDKLEGRRTGSQGIKKAGDFLIDKLKAYGIKPYFKTYRDHFTTEGEKGANIVGYIPGDDPQLKDELVILGAHYDHLGIVPDKAVKGDSIANGANDDGSGVVTILEIARILAKDDHKRSILIAFFLVRKKGYSGQNTWQNASPIKMQKLMP